MQRTTIYKHPSRRPLPGGKPSPRAREALRIRSSDSAHIGRSGRLPAPRLLAYIYKRCNATLLTHCSLIDGSRHSRHPALMGYFELLYAGTRFPSVKVSWLYKKKPALWSFGYIYHLIIPTLWGLDGGGSGRYHY